MEVAMATGAASSGWTSGAIPDNEQIWRCVTTDHTTKGKRMLKSITPIWQNLRHLPRPKMFMRSATDTSGVANGQHPAEQVAGGVGSWAFIGAQAAIIMLTWVLINALAITRIVHVRFAFAQALASPGVATH
jgi:uncharacterized membrane protein